MRARVWLVAIAIAAFVVVALVQYNNNEIDNIKEDETYQACMDWETDFNDMSYSDADVKCRLEQ